MVLSTPFTCPDGHQFTANAKIRARCPECGKVARKDFTATPPIPPVEPKTPEVPKVKPTVESPKLKSVKVLKRGPHSSVPKEKPMPKVTAKVKLLAKKGLVSHKTVRRSVVPIVRGKPSGNREHKIAKAVGEEKPYWQKVSDQYWG